MKPYYLFLFFLLSQTAWSQGPYSLSVHFEPSWLNKTLKISTAPPTSSEEYPTNITVFRCYLSQFELWKDEELAWKEEDSFHLLDAEIDSTMDLSFTVPQDLEYTSLKFQIGIDSLTSVSGVFGGDLDPTKGMFWSWNTGYIHFKLEGTDPICDTRKNRFQFHLGGYEGSYATIRPIQLPLSKKQNISIDISIDQFLQNLDLQTQNSIMIPGPEAFQLSQLAQQIFSIKHEK